MSATQRNRVLDWTLLEFDTQLEKAPFVVREVKVQRSDTLPRLYNAIAIFTDGMSVTVYGYQTVCHALGALMDRMVGIGVRS